MSRKVSARENIVHLMEQGQREVAKGKVNGSFLGRIKAYFALHMDNYASKHGRIIEGTLFILNFFAIGLFIADTYNLQGTAQTVLITVEIILVSIFFMEYAVRMWVAKNKVKHFFSVYAIIDLVSILPVLAHIGNLSFLRIFRILRLFRLLRVLRLQRMFKAKGTMFGNLSDTQLVVIRIILSAFTVIFVSAGLLWSVESRYTPDYGNIWTAMYFSVVTLSTVGYGDITPKSGLGRIITIGTILAGLALLPWQIGKLFKIMFTSATKTRIICKRCGLSEHDRDSRFCRICGLKLPKAKVVLEEDEVD